MTTTRPALVHDEDPETTDALESGNTLSDLGRMAAERLPEAADGTRRALASAQREVGRQVGEMSDLGVVAGSGFALGVSAGLLLAGASRPILALSALPVILLLRSAMARGATSARLVH